MAKKYYWLKLKNNFFSQPKIKKLRKIAGGDTYTIIYLKMQLYSLEDDGKLYFDGIEENFVEEMALKIDEDPENVGVTIQFLIAQGLMILCDDNEYLMTETQESIGSESDSAQRVRAHRERKALHCNDTVTLCNTEKEKEIEIEKENRDRVKRKEKEKEIEELFERLWKKYPEKKGKGQVSKKSKERLLDIGYEQFERAIKRYKEDLKENEWRKPQYGSTFFNTGYEDYLDKNYQPPERTAKPPVSRNLNNFERRGYDMDSLEEQLLKSN